MLNNSYRGSLLGLFFCVISYGLTFTYIIPVLSIIPGVFFEWIAKLFVNNKPYSNVAIMTIILLSAVFTISLIRFLFIVHKKIKKGIEVSNASMLSIMIFEYFVIHALGFYIYWFLVLNSRMDGQIIFSAIDSFPMSSLGFIPIGILIDFVINTTDKLFAKENIK